MHTNVRTIGGSCIIPACGTGQIVDFTTCSCRSATTGGGGTTQPGYEDQLTPFLRVGFYVGTYYCNSSSGSDQNLCLDELVPAAPPPEPQLATGPNVHKYSTLSPFNVHQDVGYLRWDLAIDASQYGAGEALSKGTPYFGTFATLIGNHSFEYRLKPNTYKSSNNIQWQDCVEHFSGSSTSQVASFNRCDLRTGSVSTTAPAAASIPLTATTNSSGLALIERLSMSGTSANRNLIDEDAGSTTSTEYGNPIALHGFGLSKYNVDDGNAATFDTAGPGLFSNLGYYKYSWGPFAVENSSGNSLSSTGTITSSTSAVTGLHFLPVSVVESSALAPDSEDGTVESRTCSHASDPCAVTAVHRTTGGNIAIQNFSPKYGNNHSSSSSTLPGGITAVGTPQIIEDTSQLSTSTTSSTTPARLRVFARATDGNIYMNYTNNRRWQSWTSLGRPWMCSAEAGAAPLDCSDPANDTENACCAKLINTAPYRTFSAFVSDYTAVPELSPNDGISIAGEPVVLSYMDTVSGIATDVVQGYIMILVRVSHLQSSDGALGTYHNAVFYNYARSTNGEVSSGSTLDFDNLSNWSGWMPVKDNDGNIFRIQGDPVGTILEVVAGTVRAHIFGTLLDSDNGADPGSGTAVLHPPIGPSSGETTAAAPATQRWYNYGNVIIRTAYTISAAVPATGTANDFVNAPNWDDIESDSRTNGTSAIIGNLSLHTRNSSIIQIYAEHLLTATHSDVNNTSPQSFLKRVAVYRYSAAGAEDPSGGGVDRVQIFDNITFVGAPQPAYVGPNTNDHDEALDGVAIAANTILGTDRVFLVGRAICPSTDGGTSYPCDRAIPSVAYMRFDETLTMNDSDAVAYFNGVAYDRDSNTYNTSAIRVSPIVATSDVVPIYSNSLDNDGADVPVYIFVRDGNGRLAVGRFLRYNAGTSGAAIWNFVVTGGYVN
ncbi:MAG TPA: hypothetical protein PLH57_01745 [Oligoflexia bacterium]|nr:hypothetical protein [Oligoflexia bacterium]